MSSLKKFDNKKTPSRSKNTSYPGLLQNNSEVISSHVNTVYTSHLGSDI